MLLDSGIQWRVAVSVDSPLLGGSVTLYEKGNLPAEKPKPAPPATGFRLNLTNKTLEFDGQVVINVHDPQTPIVYVEALVCRPDSLEHESLVMTNISARMVHAGLLALGLEPGSPGSITFEPGTGRLISRTPPTGDELIIELARRPTKLSSDGSPVPIPDSAFRPITSFLTTTKGPLNLGPFVFAGSRTIDQAQQADIKSIREQAATKAFEPYLADAIGSVIGLHTFGVEAIANTTVLSPDSGADAPYIIADKSLPPVGTPVTIRIRPAKK
jgi:hypothetical protein